MAESNHRSHRDRAGARSAPTPPRDRLDDPLAELLRLLDRTLPINDLERDARYSTPAGGRSAREFNPHAQHGYAAPDDILQKTSGDQYSKPEQSSHDFDPPSDSYDDGRYEPLPGADASRTRSAWYEHRLQSHPDAADLHAERYDEYEDRSHDHSDDHGEEYDDDPKPRGRGAFIFVAAVLGLALLGAGGIYRALFADSIVPSLPSIINAEGGPSKTIRSVSPQADADRAGSSERLVLREGRPANVPPPVSTAPQPVSTAPIFADLVPAPGLGAASVLPPSLAQPAPAARGSLTSPPATPAPPIRSANQSAAPAGPPSTWPSPATPGPKKIRTILIRTDQPNEADSAASQPQNVPVPPNGPLPILPSSNDAARAAAESGNAPPARPAPVGKPAATKIASTSPAASGGGYAVQVSSQRDETEVQSSFRALQAKYPKLLGGREPMVRRADLGAKGVYYRVMVGPFVSAEQASELCSNLKAAGGDCIVQKY